MLPGTLLKPSSNKKKSYPEKRSYISRNFQDVSGCNIKEFQEKEPPKSLYFGKWNFSAQAEEIKKNPLPEYILYPNIKKIIMFSQKKFFLYFGKYVFQKNVFHLFL